jgi:hypothetical protein
MHETRAVARCSQLIKAHFKSVITNDEMCLNLSLQLLFSTSQCGLNSFDWAACIGSFPEQILSALDLWLEDESTSSLAETFVRATTVDTRDQERIESRLPSGEQLVMQLKAAVTKQLGSLFKG